MCGGVFISYRRDDSPSAAGRIYDRLKSRLGSERVFFDIDSIGLGVDFVEVLSNSVGKCDALVVIMGRNWVSSAGKDDRRRLDDPNDFVRTEIEAALDRGIPVIPVLVDNAEMPRTEELPDGLKKLTRRQGIQISHTRFDFDVDRLTHALSWLEDEIRQREEREKAKNERKPEQAHSPVVEHPASGLGA
jgi:TIR domain